jgi:hypothetical protein
MTVLFYILIINYILAFVFTLVLQYVLKYDDDDILTKSRMSPEKLVLLRNMWPTLKYIIIIPYVFLILIIISLFQK